MLRLMPAVLLTGLVGCASIYRSMTGEPDPDIATVAAAAAPLLECPAKNVTAVNDGKGGRLEWSVNGCSKWCACSRFKDTYRCFAGPAPEWLGTDDEDLVLDMIDRLALETGCPARKIQTAASYAASTKIGFGEALGLSVGGGGRRYADRQKDRAYRLVACGHSYVCSQIDSRTDCKAALSETVAPPTETAP